MTEYELVLIAPEPLKDDIIDVLTSFDPITGFNLLTIRGYSKKHSSYSVAEQVAGYRTLYKFEILLDIEHKEALFTALAPVCESAELKYWLTPVVESGHFIYKGVL